MEVSALSPAECPTSDPIDPSDEPLGLLVERTVDVSNGRRLRLPLFLCPVRAGFPSPADDYVDKHLDLNELVIRHPAATYFLQVEGHSMIDAHIRHGDIVVVDRALEPADGHIVVAMVRGEFTVKILRRRQGRVYLVPANPEFPALDVTDEPDLEFAGVVTYIIHAALSNAHTIARRRV